MHCPSLEQEHAFRAGFDPARLQRKNDRNNVSTRNVYRFQELAQPSARRSTVRSQCLLAKHRQRHDQQVQPEPRRMGCPRRLGLPVHRRRLPSLGNSHREQHPLRKLPGNHRPLQNLHRWRSCLRHRLLSIVQRRSTASIHSSPSRCGYIDRRWRHLLGSHPGRRSSSFHKTSKVASKSCRYFHPLFFLLFRVNSVVSPFGTISPCQNSLDFWFYVAPRNHKSSQQDGCFEETHTTTRPLKIRSVTTLHVH